MNIRERSACLLATIILYQYQSVCGYDLIQTQPIPRGSSWLVNRTARRDYDEMNCGGYPTQWMKNNGNCGPCGDDYSLPPPRPHEIRGIFSDIEYRTIYRASSAARIDLFVPSQFMDAKFTFDLCPLRNIGKDNETEQCFSRYKLPLTAGPNEASVSVGPQSRQGRLTFYVQLPFTKMNRGVLRTTATTMKNYGICPNGQLGMGCGRGYETFRICSNIEIRSIFSILIPYNEGTYSGHH